MHPSLLILLAVFCAVIWILFLVLKKDKPGAGQRVHYHAPLVDGLLQAGQISSTDAQVMREGGQPSAEACRFYERGRIRMNGALAEYHMGASAAIALAAAFVHQTAVSHENLEAFSRKHPEFAPQLRGVRSLHPLSAVECDDSCAPARATACAFAAGALGLAADNTLEDDFLFTCSSALQQFPVSPG